MNPQTLQLDLFQEPQPRVHGTCPPAGSPFRFFAYYGSPNGSIFGRMGFTSEDSYRMAMWNDSALYGGHRADEETWLSKAWANIK
jgi:hypothetical protein